MQRVDTSWTDFGVEVNDSRTVNRGEGEELQGASLHPSQHWLGTSVGRRTMLLASTPEVCGQSQPSLNVVVRPVGQHAYAQIFNPCARSVFSRVYEWITWCKKRLVKRAPLWAEVWGELLCSALLVPLMCSHLDAEWNPRLEVSDAAPGGHGRAWGDIGPDDAKLMACWADSKTPYTDLTFPFGVAVGEGSRCPLHRVSLPRLKHWSKAPRLGGHRHITIEESMPWCGP